jgi:hypothetical protein
LALPLHFLALRLLALPLLVHQKAPSGNLQPPVGLLRGLSDFLRPALQTGIPFLLAP